MGNESRLEAYVVGGVGGCSVSEIGDLFLIFATPNIQEIQQVHPYMFMFLL